jgi:hypothetical protein
MILFHGTTQYFINRIKSKGLGAKDLFPYCESTRLRDVRQDLFHGVIGETQAVFFGPQPSSGPDDKPLDKVKAWRRFAGCGNENWEGDCYLVVVDLPVKVMMRKDFSWFVDEKVIAIFETSVLDGYQKLHSHWCNIQKDNLFQDNPHRAKKILEQAQKERFASEAAYISLDPPCMYMKPDWLRGKMLKRVIGDCQVLTTSIPPNYIVDIFKVFTKEGEYVPEFNPQKHKPKTFNDLVWSRVPEKRKQIRIEHKYWWDQEKLEFE